ncbi:MAG: hypothetical protein U1F43_26265 [Myxococcota bacterium]
MAGKVVSRVHEDGIAADGGTFSAYKDRRKPPRKGDRFYWSPVGAPQPERNRLAIGKGKNAGRAAYASWEHYRDALGEPLAGNR